MWNPFKKNNRLSTTSNSGAGDPNKMGMLQRLAMKKMMSMSDAERAKIMQKFMTPENIAKNRDKIAAAMEQMKASGMLSEEQAAMAKKQFGL